MHDTRWNKLKILTLLAKTRISDTFTELMITSGGLLARVAQRYRPFFGNLYVTGPLFSPELNTSQAFSSFLCRFLYTQYSFSIEQASKSCCGS